VNDFIFSTLGKSYNCHGRLKNDLACGQVQIGKRNKYRILKKSKNKNIQL